MKKCSDLKSTKKLKIQDLKKVRKLVRKIGKRVKTENQKKNLSKPPKTEENLGKKHTAAANGPAHPVRRFRRERIAPAMSGE
jgi:hypothetical protein